MANANTANISLTQVAGLAFPPPEMKDALIAASARGAGITTGFDDGGDNSVGHKKSKKDDDSIGQNYISSITNNSNILLSIGGLALTALDIANSTNAFRDFHETQLDILTSIDGANQGVYMTHADGTLFTQEEIAAYEDTNNVCVANPYEISADIAATQTELSAIEDVERALANGETIELADLTPSLAQQLVRDKITEQIANGETVDLSTLPPEFHRTAIDTMIGAETEAAGIAAYQNLGLTEQDFRNGAVFTDEHAGLRDDYLSGMQSWEEARRAELGAEAGTDYEAPAPRPTDPQLSEERVMQMTGMSLLPPSV